MTAIRFLFCVTAAGLARQKWPESLYAVTDFPRTPVRVVDLPVDLDEADAMALVTVGGAGSSAGGGADTAAALRGVLLSWWVVSHG